MPAALGPVVHNAAHRHVVGFGSAGGEDDFLRFGANLGCNLLARLFDAPLRPQALLVKGGGVAVFLPHHMQGQISHFRQNLGGGCIVKINLLHS